jgi:hypothetical protein
MLYREPPIGWPILSGFIGKHHVEQDAAVVGLGGGEQAVEVGAWASAAGEISRVRRSSGIEGRRVISLESAFRIRTTSATGETAVPSSGFAKAGELLIFLPDTGKEDGPAYEN